MGVKGLLQCLQSITRPVSFDRYSGLTVAVDAMSWLHKGVFAGDVRSMAKEQWNEREYDSTGATHCDTNPKNCESESYNTDNVARKLHFKTPMPKQCSKQLADEHCHPDVFLSSSSGSASVSKCVSYAIRHAETLRKDFDMEVIMVIDGGSLPSKAEVDKERRRERHRAFKEAIAAEAKGDSRIARRLFARACSVTYEMRYELIKSCKQAGISFVVAPYEADAQMAKLAHSGTVDLIITEDSDLLAYGCPRVLFKADFSTCKGEEIQLMRDLAANDSPSFQNWTHDMFVFMCILSGCDYFEGIPGVGIKTAQKFVRIHRTPSKIFNALRAAGKMCENLEESFLNAYRTFRHQRVYCIEKKEVETLFPIEKGGDTDTTMVWPFLGPWIEPEIAKGIATGVLHPKKKVPWGIAVASADRIRSKQQIVHANHEEYQNSIKEQVGGSIASRRNENSCSDENIAPAKTSKIDSKNMFLFFQSKKRKRQSVPAQCQNSSGDEDSSTCRPPMNEVFICDNLMRDQNDKSTKGPQNIIPLTSGCTQPIPIHFNDYSSKLVGKTFETLSRRSRKGLHIVKNISQAVHRLKNQAKHVEGKNIKKRRKINIQHETSSKGNSNDTEKEDSSVRYKCSQPSQKTKVFQDPHVRCNGMVSKADNADSRPLTTGSQHEMNKDNDFELETDDCHKYSCNKQINTQLDLVDSAASTEMRHVDQSNNENRVCKGIPSVMNSESEDCQNQSIAGLRETWPEYDDYGGTIYHYTPYEDSNQACGEENNLFIEQNRLLDDNAHTWTNMYPSASKFDNNFQNRGNENEDMYPSNSENDYKATLAQSELFEATTNRGTLCKDGDFYEEHIHQEHCPCENDKNHHILVDDKKDPELLGQFETVICDEDDWQGGILENQSTMHHYSKKYQRGIAADWQFSIPANDVAKNCYNKDGKFVAKDENLLVAINGFMVL